MSDEPFELAIVFVFPGADPCSNAAWEEDLSAASMKLFVSEELTFEGGEEGDRDAGPVVTSA